MFVDNSIKGARSYFQEKLSGLYSKKEIDTFFEWCCIDKFDFSKSDILLNSKQFSESELLEIRSIVERLKMDIPIQYVLQEAHFFGHRFNVGPDVLIPRSETEELVQEIISDGPQGRVLDIGTGSGVIAISLKLAVPELDVYGVDVLFEALKVARKNAKSLGAEVVFEQLDILSQEPDKMYDIIVSNPPYVLESDKKDMSPNILDHEPGLALFVPDNEPLKFYERICKICHQNLSPGGSLYFEIHENFGSEIINLLKEHCFIHLHTIKDLQGKNRIVKAKKSFF